jgi:hypothetical protein
MARRYSKFVVAQIRLRKSSFEARLDAGCRDPGQTIPKGAIRFTTVGPNRGDLVPCHSLDGLAAACESAGWTR